RTVATVIDESDESRFGVVKIVATLLRRHEAKPASTTALLSRAGERCKNGHASEAVALARCAVLRGDAPAQATLVVAEALAASGNKAAAATELETFASACETNDPAASFDAVRRALDLRDGDATTAARLCDHYLAHANQLRSRSGDALAALKRLVHSAPSAG